MWCLDGNTARLSAAALGGTVNLLRPSAGLQAVQIGGKRISDARLLGIQFEGTAPDCPEDVADAYTRTSELIVTYDHSPSQTVRAQVYWRAIAESSPADLSGIELIISVQTTLLDSNPVANLKTQIPAVEVLLLSSEDKQNTESIQLTHSSRPACVSLDNTSIVLFRLPRSDWSYAEFVHPADRVSSQLEFDSTSLLPHLTHQLFAERLEKGVIRRGRVRGMFVARNRDERLAFESYQQLLSAAPPLTA